jgi:dTDP-4-dehydrorhamnose 3,5-epimerase
MEIQTLKIPGTYEITLSPIGDSRGFFMRTFDLNGFNKYGLNKIWVQENHARSAQKGIIRGLHFQFPPYAETKLVRCIRGKILDVFVDLRKDSNTFGQWDSIELSEENKNMVFIPRGFAHGYCTLTEESEVLYKVDNFYAPEYEGGLLWNDSDIGIQWPVSDPILSDKDKRNMSFKEFVDKYKYIEHR